MAEAEKEIKTPEYTEIETKAMEDGWIPPDRFDKADTGKEFISAEKFLENGSFFKKINEQKKRIDEQDKALKQVMEHNQKVAAQDHKRLQAEHKAEIERLKAEKVQALDEGDNAKVVEIDDQILNTPKPEPVQAETGVFDSWVAENKWYNDDRFLRTEAIKVGEILNSDGLYGAELFKAVENHIKEAFPDKFKNPKREDPADVEGGGDHKPSGKAATVNSLNAQEKEVYENFDRMGVFKSDDQRKQYLKDVISLRS